MTLRRKFWWLCLGVAFCYAISASAAVWQILVIGDTRWGSIAQGIGTLVSIAAATIMLYGGDGALAGWEEVDRTLIKLRAEQGELLREAQESDAARSALNTVAQRRQDDDGNGADRPGSAGAS
jgi:hypothetical protein